VWQQRYDRHPEMFVDVSGRKMASPLFPREVRDIVTRSGMRAGTLGLEVTESVLTAAHTTSFLDGRLLAQRDTVTSA